MDQRRHSLLFALHGWTGLVLSLVLFVIMLTGALSVLSPDIQRWERADPRPSAPITLTEAYDTARALSEDSHGIEVEFFSISIPQPDHPWIDIFLHGHSHETAADGTETEGPDQNIFYSVHHDGSVEQVAHLSPLATFLVELHTDLWIPAPWGRYLVGLIGIAFLALAISGVLIHGHALRDMMLWRTGRSMRLFWSDAHKLIGIVGLPFHLVVGLTGTMLGLTGIFLTAIAFAAFGGDVDAAIEAVLGPQAVEQHVKAPLADLDPLVADAPRHLDDFTPRYVFAIYPGDAGAGLAVAGDTQGRLVYLEQVRYDGTSGAFDRAGLALGGTAGQRVLGAITPLHFGSYGGAWLRGLYCLLGLVGALMAATGASIFVDRNLARRTAEGTSPGGYGVLRRLTAGLFSGAGVAACALFALIAVSGQHMNVSTLTLTALGTAGLAVLAGFVAGDPKNALRLQLAAGLVLLLIALGAGPAFSGGGFSLVDGLLVVLLVIGGLGMAQSLRPRRSVRPQTA